MGVECVAYTVVASLPDRGVTDEYVAWLKDGHVDAVIAHGARSAHIVRLDREGPNEDEPFRVEVRYVFPTREVFQRYVERHAPGLRADGLKRFGPERGVRFSRTVGEIV